MLLLNGIWLVVVVVVLLLPVVHGTSSSSIVGGTVVATDELYPYYAINKNAVLACGATLIHERVLLSAAHCADAFISDGVVIGGGFVRNVMAQVIHPDYATGTLNYRNDIMLLLLNDAVTTIAPVSLLLDRSSSSGDVTTIMGYGGTFEGGPVSTSLLHANVTIATDDFCETQYGTDANLGYDRSVMFCAGGNGKDACQGDSGGPAVAVPTDLADGHDHHQVGIVSFGIGCAREEYYGVYTKLSAYESWIQDTMNNLLLNDANEMAHCKHPAGLFFFFHCK